MMFTRSQRVELDWGKNMAKSQLIIYPDDISFIVRLIAMGVFQKGMIGTSLPQGLLYIQIIDNISHQSTILLLSAQLGWIVRQTAS